MRAALIAASVLILAACNMSAASEEVEDEGPRVARDFPVGAFERVALGGSQDVIVTVGGAPSVRAEGTAKALDRLEIKVEGGELRIGTRRNSGNFFTTSGRTTVHVTVPSLRAASVAGSGDMRIDKVQGGDFEAAIAGSGDLEIGTMQVGTARVGIAGSGDVTASGTAERTEVNVAGSGNVALDGLQAKRATVSIVGSGDVSAHASESAVVTIMGSGDVKIAGGAKCTVNKQGSGSVDCGG